MTVGPLLDTDALRGSVVVAVDGSEHAVHALRWAADQAVLEHRRLVVLTVGDPADPDVPETAADAAATARLHHDTLPVLTQVVLADPRQALVEASTHAFVLVMGSRGRGAFRSILLGSVSAAVTAHAHCPIVVCRPRRSAASHAGIVVGADGTPESLPVVEFAYRQAFLRGRPLTVMHTFVDAAAAVAAYREARGQDASRPELDDLRATLAQSVAGLEEDYPGVPVTLCVEHGLADQVLAPRRGGWELVVVGRHPMSSLDRVLSGSVSTAVLERAHTDVAVVPEQRERVPR